MELHCNDTKRRRKERPGLKQLLGALAAASLIAIPGIASAEGGSHYGMNKHQAMNVSHNWGEFKAGKGYGQGKYTAAYRWRHNKHGWGHGPGHPWRDKPDTAASVPELSASGAGAATGARPGGGGWVAARGGRSYS